MIYFRLCVFLLLDAVSLLVDSCQRLTSDPRPLVEAARTGKSCKTILQISNVLDAYS